MRGYAVPDSGSGELSAEQAARREDEADQGGRVLQDHGLHCGVRGVPEVALEGCPPRVPPPRAPGVRRCAGRVLQQEGDREHDVRDQGVARLLARDKGVDAES